MPYPKQDSEIHKKFYHELIGVGFSRGTFYATERHLLSFQKPHWNETDKEEWHGSPFDLLS